MASPEEIRARIVKHGGEVADRVIATLPYSYSLLTDQIRSIIKTYKNNYETLINNLSNVKNIDLYILYFILISILLKYKNMNIDELKTISSLYEKYIYDVFSASKIRRVLEEAGLEKDLINQVISQLVKTLNILSNNYHSIYMWIIKQRKISNFENEIREIIFSNEGGNRVGRGVKTFLRLFIHESNIPLAVKIAFSPEAKKYTLHGDIYTVLVTLRSGAFEDVNSITAERIKARIAKRIICEEKRGKEKCKEVLLRLESIRGLVRHVGKISGDPVLYERGAYDIGVKYCKDLKCEACPIRDVCRRYEFIVIK